jgi:hypothetical protein
VLAHFAAQITLEARAVDEMPQAAEEIALVASKIAATAAAIR